jgi:hypothetical protein
MSSLRPEKQSKDMEIMHLGSFCTTIRTLDDGGAPISEFQIDTGQLTDIRL